MFNASQVVCVVQIMLFIKCLNAKIWYHNLKKDRTGWNNILTGMMLKTDKGVNIF